MLIGRLKSVAGVGNTRTPPMGIVVNNDPYRSLDITKGETKLTKRHSNLFVRRLEVVGRVEGTSIRENEAKGRVEPHCVI